MNLLKQRGATDPGHARQVDIHKHYIRAAVREFPLGFFGGAAGGNAAKPFVGI